MSWFQLFNNLNQEMQPSFETTKLEYIRTTEYSYWLLSKSTHQLNFKEENNKSMHFMTRTLIGLHLHIKNTWVDVHFHRIERISFYCCAINMVLHVQKDNVGSSKNRITIKIALNMFPSSMEQSSQSLFDILCPSNAMNYLQRNCKNWNDVLTS